MPVMITADEYATVDGLPMATPAWRDNGISAWLQPADQKGDDRDIPDRDGSIAYPNLLAESQRSVPISIFGGLDQNGATQTNPRAGMWANYKYLKANVIDPPGTPNGTRVVTVHTSDGAVFASGNVKVEGFSYTRKGTVIRGTLKVTFPDGELTIL